MPSTNAALAEPTTVYAKPEHGGYPVKILPPGSRENQSKTLFVVTRDTGEVVYDTGRQLIRSLYNEGEIGPGTRDPGMSVDRYFKIGKFKPSDPLLEPLPFLESSLDQSALVDFGVGPLIRVGQTTERRHRETRVRVPELKTHPLLIGVNGIKGKPLEPASWATPLGIDLENRSHEVRKLLFAGFGPMIHAKGYDPEDVYQEVLRGILARNQGKCPWDEKKSTFGHYVHMVCRGVVFNYHRKQKRRAEFEQVGMYGLDGDGEYGVVDAAETPATYSVTHASSLDPDEQVGMEMAVGSLTDYIEATGRPESGLAIKVLPYVSKGYQRSEIADELGVEPSKVGKALSLIRKTARVWQEDLA